MGDDRLQQIFQEVTTHVDRFETEILELGVLGVVVVLLHFGARVRHGDDFRAQANLLTGFGDHFGEFVDGELFGELVVHLHFTVRRRVVASDLDAADGVSDVQETARLATLTVDSHRVSDGGLDAEAVERGTEDGVVVEAVDQIRVHVGLIGGDTVDDTLVQVGGANVPRLGAEQHVGRVVALGQVVEGATLLRVREGIGATVVGDGDVTLFDVDIRGTVLTHGAELDHVALRGELLDGVQDVDGTHDVVRLREHGAGAVHHGVRGRALLTKVNARGRLELLERGGQEFIVADVADEEVDILAADFLPLANALVDTLDRSQRVEAELIVKSTAAQVVNDGHGIATLGKVEGGRPAAIAVAADNHDALTLAGVRSVGVRAVRGGHSQGARRALRANVRDGGLRLQLLSAYDASVKKEHEISKSVSSIVEFAPFFKNIPSSVVVILCTQTSPRSRTRSTRRHGSPSPNPHKGDSRRRDIPCTPLPSHLPVTRPTATTPDKKRRVDKI